MARAALRVRAVEEFIRVAPAIAVGAAANLTVFDPEASWTVEATALASKSRNTPYQGRTVRGRVRHTLLNGRAVVIDGAAQR